MSRIEKELLRARELMGCTTSVNENKVSSTKGVEYSAVGADGKTYGIIKEMNKYYIKTLNDGTEMISENFDYIGGFRNKGKYEYASCNKAIKQLELKLQSINEAYGITQTSALLNPSKKESVILEGTDKMKGEIRRQREIMKSSARTINESMSIDPESMEFEIESAIIEPEDEMEGIEVEKVEITGDCEIKVVNIDGTEEVIEINSTEKVEDEVDIELLDDEPQVEVDEYDIDIEKLTDETELEECNNILLDNQEMNEEDEVDAPSVNTEISDDIIEKIANAIAEKLGDYQSCDDKCECDEKNEEDEDVIKEDRLKVVINANWLNEKGFELLTPMFNALKNIKKEIGASEDEDSITKLDDKAGIYISIINDIIKNYEEGDFHPNMKINGKKLDETQYETLKNAFESNSKEDIKDMSESFNNLREFIGNIWDEKVGLELDKPFQKDNKEYKKGKEDELDVLDREEKEFYGTEDESSNIEVVDDEVDIFNVDESVSSEFTKHPGYQKKPLSGNGCDDGQPFGTMNANAEPFTQKVKVITDMVVKELHEILKKKSEILEKKVIKVDVNKSGEGNIADNPTPPETTEVIDDIVSDDVSLELPKDDNTSPFGSKFDAGIEVDEDDDPVKYIQKLTGKLAQKLRDFNSKEEDESLNKYVGGMIMNVVNDVLSPDERDEVLNNEPGEGI